jgi:hypothetical protein
LPNIDLNFQLTAWLKFRERVTKPPTSGTRTAMKCLLMCFAVVLPTSTKFTLKMLRCAHLVAVSILLLQLMIVIEKVDVDIDNEIFYQA